MSAQIEMNIKLRLFAYNTDQGFHWLMRLVIIND